MLEGGTGSSGAFSPIALGRASVVHIADRYKETRGLDEEDPAANHMDRWEKNISRDR